MTSLPSSMGEGFAAELPSPTGTVHPEAGEDNQTDDDGEVSEAILMKDKQAIARDTMWDGGDKGGAGRQASADELRSLVHDADDAPAYRTSVVQ